jgi:hypothetical protein
MPQEITARELLKLVLDDEEFNSGKGPRSIVGFDSLLEKMDKLCDAITQRESNGEGYEGGHSEEMKALVANLEAIKELLDKPAVELPDRPFSVPLPRTPCAASGRGSSISSATGAPDSPKRSLPDQWGNNGRANNHTGRIHGDGAG